MDRYVLTAPQSAPAGGCETFAETLALSADAFLARIQARTGGGIPDMDRRNAAAIYRLAADAMDSAAARTIGHGSGERREFRADGLRIKADETERGEYPT